MLLDTSGLLCVALEAEPFHAEASAAFLSAPRRLTHGYVLAEWVALAFVRGVPRADALQFVIDLADSPDIKVVWVDEGLHRDGVDLPVARPDKGYSLCDAVSFLLMRRDGTADALTTDKHFEQEGFVRLLK